jgi:uncharacterized membrane protein
MEEQRQTMPDPLAGGLCYIMGPASGLLFLIWGRYRRNHFVRFHAWQSVFYSLASFLSFAVVAVGAAMLPLELISVIQAVTGLWMAALIVMWFCAMWKAMNGAEWNLPLVGTLARACR